MRPLIPLVLIAAACGPVAHPPLTGRIDEVPLTSSITGEHYLLFVRTPPGYDDEAAARWPAVFQLDANFLGFDQFGVTAGYASALEASGETRPAIVVGVGYQPGHEGRFRDFNPQRDLFLRALREEIIPTVDERWRVDADFGRALFGHSMGGFMSLYTMISTATEANPPFRHFVAADPSLSNADYAVFRAELGLREVDAALAERSLLVRTAKLNGAGQRALRDELDGRLSRYQALRFDGGELDTDHGGSIAPSFEAGLRFVLGGVR